MKSIWSPPTAFCLLLSAYCLYDPPGIATPDLCVRAKIASASAS
jgi:hypothetical protein